MAVPSHRPGPRRRSPPRPLPAPLRRPLWGQGLGQPPPPSSTTTRPPRHAPGLAAARPPRPAATAPHVRVSAFVLPGHHSWVHSAWQIEQGYKQVKSELGWADFQVRADRAIRRHWTLVCCAFSFCWHAGQTEAAPAPPASPLTATGPTAAAGQAPARGAPQRLDPDPVATGGGRGGDVVAQGTARGAGLADSVGVAAALLARMVDQRAAPSVAAGA